MMPKTRKIGDGSVVDAFIGAVRDLRDSSKPDISPVPDDLRIDGKTCLVTGANSGLGRAASIDLARRGGNVILACRPGHTETRGEIRRLSGSNTVEMVEVDLADLQSVHRCCDQLARRGVQIDIALMNAGLVTRESRRTPQGYETTFAVNFLSKRVMIDRWLEDGVIRPSSRAGETPRIVFISSESHRSAHEIDFDRFGEFTEYGLKESLKYYSLSKLVLCTYAAELSRRLNPSERVDVAVHSMCPGGVATNIAREAPMLVKPLVGPVLRVLFQSPEKAIRPVIYLCCAQEADAETGTYLHLMRRKPLSPSASDPVNGTRLWEASEALVAESRELR